MFLLQGAVKRYPWGSSTAIPAILSRQPDGTPWAEYWLGAHPDGPATTAEGHGLDDFIHHHPASLGDGSRTTFGDRLPFLVKILAAATPLSIQVHPSREQAEAGHAQENTRGMARDSPERSFRDDWPKPEIVIALDTFDALIGLRDAGRTANLLDGLKIPEITPIVTILAHAKPGPDSVREAFLAVRHNATQDMVRTLAGAVESAEQSDSAQSDSAQGEFLDTARILTRTNPDDPSIFAALMLNRVRLHAREALFVPAGTLHAYLQGVGVEVMGASDNVVRGGLTSKHIDIPALAHIGNFTPQTPSILTPHAEKPGLLSYRTGAPEFRVWLVEPPETTVHLPAVDRARIIVGLSGELTLDTGNATSILRQGCALFLEAGETAAVRGRGTAALVCSGHHPDPFH